MISPRLQPRATRSRTCLSLLTGEAPKIPIDRHEDPPSADRDEHNGILKSAPTVGRAHPRRYDWERVSELRGLRPSPACRERVPEGGERASSNARTAQLFAPLSRLPGEGPRRGGEGLCERTHSSVVCAPLPLAGRGSPKGGRGPLRTSAQLSCLRPSPAKNRSGRTRDTRVCAANEGCLVPRPSTLRERVPEGGERASVNERTNPSLFPPLSLMSSPSCLDRPKVGEEINSTPSGQVLR
jgi:hypothetical protein